MSMSGPAQAEAADLTEHELDGEIPAASLDGAVGPYPGDIKYWVIALILGVLTAVEVTTYSHPDFILWDNFATPALLIMMGVKFFIVTWFFMHLKFDNKLLTYVFYAGLGLASAVYLATLASFRLFT